MLSSKIPTQLVIGFLGVGKTTVIRHLLSQVPDGERWAVLVNEFGEIGIDGALMQADDIVVHEVTGGCLCCVAAEGLTSGLNRLIRDQNPDRILIEPTGLGHPAQVLDALTKPLFHQALDIKATIGLVDARHLSQSRYREHETWQDQVFLADVLVGSKADRYSDTDRQAFADFVGQLEPEKARTGQIEQGRVPIEWLDVPRGMQRKAHFPEAHVFMQVQTQSSTTKEPRVLDPWLRVEQEDEGMFACGWCMSVEHVFHASRLRIALGDLRLQRLKGVFQTDMGWLAFNRSEDDMAVETVSRREDSRLELIHSQSMGWLKVDALLRRCLMTAPH